MNYWAVPRCWPGETVAVFATGPSLSQEVCDKVRDAGLNAIAVNDAYRLAPWAGFLFASDLLWWRTHAEAVKDFSGHKVTTQPGRDIDGVHRLRRTEYDGYDPNPSHLRFGGNSGYQAVHLAIHTGAARILLCGFDMHTRGGIHFFGKHAEPLHNPTDNRMSRWAARFKNLNGHGAQIINCTPGSALTCFENRELDEVLGA